MSPRRFDSSAVRLLGFVVAVTPLFVPPGVSAQEAAGGADPLESFADSVSVEVVNVEVWVTDRKGQSVTGLARDDFELLEDGERVTIANFAAYEAAAPAEPGAAGEPTPATPRPERSAGARSRTGEGSLHLAVLVDDWNLRPEDRARVLDDLRVFLDDHVHPGDRVMVAVHDRALQLVQSFTSDSDALTRSLARVERAAPSGVSLRNERRGALEAIREAWDRAVAEVRLSPGTPEPCVSGWGEMENAARSYAAAVEGHVQRSAGALASLAQILTGVPGRKVLLYVGNGMEQQAGAEMFHHLVELCPHRQSEVSTYSSIYDLTRFFEEVARRANAGRITLYALEAEAPVAGEDLTIAGPQSPVYDPREDVPSLQAGGARPDSGSSTGSYGQVFRPSATVRRQAERNREDTLVFMARETGGRAILNAADFGEDLDRLGADLATHYSLGFSPGHAGDGRSHRLEVRVKAGDGYRVRHRRAYVDRPPEQRMADRIRAVAQFGEADAPGAGSVAVGAANPLQVRVETGEATPAAGGRRVPLRLWVPLAKLTLVPHEGALQGRLRVMMAVSDARGNLGPVRQKLVPVEVRDEADGEAPSRDKLVEIQLDLDGEEHVVALGVRDEIGGDVSYLRHPIRVTTKHRARADS